MVWLWELQVGIFGFRCNGFYYMQTVELSKEPVPADFPAVLTIPKVPQEWEIWKNAAKKKLWMQYHLEYAVNGFRNYYVLNPYKFTHDNSDDSSTQGDVSENDNSGEESDQEGTDIQNIWDKAPRWENIDYGESYTGATRPPHLPDHIDEAKYKNLVTTASNSVHVSGVWSDFPPHSDSVWKKTVIIDLDRNVLTVDGKNHFRLPGIPSDFLTSENGQGKLPDVYLPPPIPDPEFVALYESYSPTILSTDMLLPNSNRTRRTVASFLVSDLFDRYLTNKDFYLKECQPTDVPFQKIAYACIKLSSVDQMEMKRAVEPFSYVSETENWVGLRHIKPPLSDMYSVPGGKYGEVLLLLAHPCISKDPKAAIGRVIKYAQTMQKKYLIACIFSIETVIFVDVALESTGPRVSHTSPEFGNLFDGQGRELLASAFVPCTVSYGAYLDHILPPELILQIFRDLCHSEGNMDDVLNWRLTCRAFKDLADSLTIPFKPNTVLNFPTTKPNNFVTLHSNGGDTHPSRWGPVDRETGKRIGLCSLKIIHNN